MKPKNVISGVMPNYGQNTIYILQRVSKLKFNKSDESGDTLLFDRSPGLCLQDLNPNPMQSDGRKWSDL